MTPRALVRLLTAWLIVTLALCVVVHRRARIKRQPMPDARATRWAVESLRMACAQLPFEAPPESARDYRAPGVVLVNAWKGGRRIHRHQASGTLEEVVRDSARAFEQSAAMRGVACADTALYFTIDIVHGKGALVTRVPYLSALSLVPLHDGLSATWRGKTAWLTPSDLVAAEAYDHGIPTPLPELKLGVDLNELTALLARELDADPKWLTPRGTLERWRIETLSATPYPREVEVTEERLREHARRGARFLARHQFWDGRYSYIYSGRTGSELSVFYDVPRHAGTTWFLALVGRINDDVEARQAARRGLEWLSVRSIACGSPERRCATLDGTARVDIGSTALATSAAAEYLAGGDDEAVRALVRGYTAFLRSQQRSDGEFMHEYDVARARPVDVQYLYYSGEAALGLLRAYQVLGDRRDLDAARRALAHLTGRSWNFFGSRYYYGEEHWTCVAAGHARGLADTREALDFCRRWADWNLRLQYRAGETPWRSTGTYGVGPILVPMLTPTGSRTEAFVSTWELARHHGTEIPGLRAQIERGLAALMRHQWTPGPAFLFADPLGADGGMPMGAASLTVRDDYVQHSGAAMIRWADVLRRERLPSR
jgi:hypothetical protein